MPISPKFRIFPYLNNTINTKYNCINKKDAKKKGKLKEKYKRNKEYLKVKKQ